MHIRLSAVNGNLYAESVGLPVQWAIRGGRRVAHLKASGERDPSSRQKSRGCPILTSCCSTLGLGF